MVRHTAARIGIPVLAASLALSACGSRSGSTGGSSSSSGGSSSASGGSGGGGKVATIGVIAPLSADLAPLGLGIQHSVELAVKQANANKTIPGWTLKVSAKDDQATPSVGQNAATSLAGDDTVVGVVGTLNSSVAQSVQPVLNSAKIVEVSPANTNPSLTKGANFLTAPKRAYATYFRTCTTDAIQGPFAARYLFQKQGVKKVATINDKKTYGQGLVAAFTTEFKKLGGQVVSAQTINPDDSNFSAVISKVKPSSPKAVYYGGEFPQAGPLSQQMKQAGLNVPLMGGDGIFDPHYISLAGKTSNGDFATSVGAPTEKLATAKTYIADYKAAGFKDPYGAYGAYAYDAANSIINALKTSLASASDAKSARQATVTAMSTVSFNGVTGKVGFDQYGDSTTRILTVYKVVSGAWSPVSTADFK